MTFLAGTESENKLVDLCFSMVGTASDPKNQKQFGAMTHDQRMAWVAKQLKECGFPTIPIGSTWGRIIDPTRMPEGLKDQLISE